MFVGIAGFGCMDDISYGGNSSHVPSCYVLISS